MAAARAAPRAPGTQNHQDSQKHNSTLRDFQGINTQAYRTVIGDDQFAWLENVMPVGFGNLIAPPGPSAALASWPGTAYHMRSIDIGATTYMVVFTTNGAVYAVNLSTYDVTTVAVAGTLSGDDSEICQWNNTNAIIVDSNGYYSWDGSTFTKWNGTLQSLTITSIGKDYTSQPTIGGFGTGGGSGGAATCDIQVGTYAINAGGTGYVVGDVLTVAGGTAVEAATLVVTAASGAGAVTGVNLTSSGDYTAAPGNPVSVTGGHGTLATFNLNFGIGPITLTTIGSGYTSAPTITVTGGGGTLGAVTADLSAVPPGGQSVATYAGRVWVASGRTILFSAPDGGQPNPFADFSSANAGGSFIMLDETLTGNVQALRAANNFLYVVGASSVDVIADVAVVNGVTTFSKTNISANVGTEFANSVISYYRAMWLANPYGIYAIYGATTQKASDPLDGIFPLLLTSESVPAQKITAGLAIINEILCLCFLAQYNDPVAGQRSIIFVFFNKKWWIASPRDDLVKIESAIINGAPLLYGTNGTSLFSLFSTPAYALAQTIVTKLWDMGDALRDKQVLKFGLEIVNPADPQTVTGTIDTESSSSSFSLAGGNTAQWINNLGNVIPWVNNSGQTVNWISSGYSFRAMDVSESGKYIGITLQGFSAGAVYNGMHLQYELRATW